LILCKPIAAHLAFAGAFDFDTILFSVFLRDQIAPDAYFMQARFDNKDDLRTSNTKPVFFQPLLGGWPRALGAKEQGLFPAPC
jgi:hypothetical protein